ncbi:hypothetical protein K474DRAFT_1521402 [Panus rudis PR-1116 ss-1]|nr:hypothetical protein K474DRAFT_1521402 [Panus rudis PR-1116 ss-1]
MAVVPSVYYLTFCDHVESPIFDLPHIIHVNAVGYRHALLGVIERYPLLVLEDRMQSVTALAYLLVPRTVLYATMPCADAFHSHSFVLWKPLKSTAQIPRLTGSFCLYFHVSAEAPLTALHLAHFLLTFSCHVRTQYMILDFNFDPHTLPIIQSIAYRISPKGANGIMVFDRNLQSVYDDARSGVLISDVGQCPMTTWPMSCCQHDLCHCNRQMVSECLRVGRTLLHL